MTIAVLATCFTACKKDDDDPDDVVVTPPEAAPTNMLYVTTNNPSGNAVVAYTRDMTSGAITQMGTYSTGGNGFSNPTANKLGPNDADQALTVDDDHHRLFAANGGSNTIAVFNMHANGTLEAVAGSPFPSGGRQPVSLDVYGNKLYVVNKNEDTLQSPNSDLPNYTVFNIGSGGQLTQVMGSTVNTLSMASPSQALVSRNGELLFGADFLIPATHPGSGSLRSFMVGATGITSAPGSPLVVPGDPMTSMPLGLWQHPTEDVLYVGLPARNKLGVFTFGSNGGLVYETEVNNSGAAICWVRTTADGSRTYTLNSLSNSISLYNTSTATSPSESQHFFLSEPGPMFTNLLGLSQVTSGPFFFELAPDERFLYTLNQRQDYFSSSSDGNNIHIVTVGSDGTLSEPFATVSVPTPATARPVGIVVL
jgi:6-phosphogluconolactonase (cycloisomerase 2 family)